jgi:DNA polymerase/3'-5' exonuclease PolX
MTTKEQIAEALEEIATLLELKEENPFKIRAYQNAARSIEAFGASFSDLQNQEALEKIPGIGKAIAAKISELATTGGLKFLDELRAEFPSAILELFSIPGLGAKKIKALYEKLKFSSIADLQRHVNPVESRSYRIRGDDTDKNLQCLSLIARNMPVPFNSAKSLQRLNSCAATWPPIPMPRK